MKRMAIVLLLMLVASSAFGDKFNKGLAGAAGSLHDFSRDMLMYEMQRQRDEAMYQRQLREQRAIQEQAELDAQLEQAREELKVEAAHPGWIQTVRTKEFAKWMSQQPDSVRRLAQSNQAQDAILMLDLYKRDRNAVNQRR